MSRSSQKVSHWHSTESGSILIIVLWMVTLTAIIATTLATEIRLSSRIVHAQKQKVSEWAETLEALHSAEMELMLHKMPLPVTDNWESMKVGARPAELSFDGSAVTTAYPSPSSMNIHIFDHSGKISLVALTRNRLRMLLLKTVGDDEIALESLLNSWEDWIDKDSLKRINGAEEKFYQALTPPYLPRNGPLDSVEEILDIRGFLPIFGAIELSSAFTLHTTHNTINPNLATLEALHLLPGLSASSIEQIVSLRQEEPFQNMEALTEILPPEEFSVAREWFGFHYSNTYTIAIVPHSAPEGHSAENKRRPVIAYTEDVRVQGYKTPPTTVAVRPSVLLTLPTSATEQLLAEQSHNKRGQ